MIRRLIKSGFANAIERAGLRRMAARAGGRALPLVLGYHRVAERFPQDSRQSMAPMLISRDMLRRHLEETARRFRFVTLDELGAAVESGEAFERRLAAVTFDDGYEDVYDVACPLLRQMGIPAAVFVVTDLVGTSRLQLHDRLYLTAARALDASRSPEVDVRHLLLRAGLNPPSGRWLRTAARDPFTLTGALLKTLPQDAIERALTLLENCIDIPVPVRAQHRAMSWDMLKDLLHWGFTVGSHTRSHALLTNESESKVREETRGSRQRLEARLGTPIRHFAYPDGRYDEVALRVVANAGYRFGYTTCGHRDQAYPNLTIPRKVLWEWSCVDSTGRFSPAIFECHVHSIFDLFSPCRQRHRSAASLSLAQSNLTFGIQPHERLEHT